MSYDDQDFESSKKTSTVDAEDDPFESRAPKKYDDSGDSELTVYVGGVPFDSTTQDIEDLFKDCGTVSSVRMPTYPDSGRSRGFAYVVFGDAKGVDAALNLNGTDFMGRSIKVEKSRGKTGDRSDRGADRKGADRYGARTERSDRGGDRAGGERRGGGDATTENTVFLGNLAFNASEDDIRDAFEDCGTISAIRIPTDRNTGKVRGFGYVSFDSSSGVEKAIGKTGVDISGRSVRVDYASGKGGAGGSSGGRGGDRGGDRDRGYGGRGGSGGSSGGRYYDRKSDHSSRRYRDEY